MGLVPSDAQRSRTPTRAEMLALSQRLATLEAQFAALALRANQGLAVTGTAPANRAIISHTEMVQTMELCLALRCEMLVLGGKVDGIARDCARMLAYAANQEILRKNRRVFEGRSGTEVKPLNKCCPGYLAIPQELQAGMPAVLAGEPPAPGPGVVPPPEIAFPRTNEEMLTECQIAWLARWYNDDFGIEFVGEERGEVEEQMSKVRWFLGSLE
ncbi:hypothetical protein HDU96_006814 [Phlyctochytrium bullatum]|nr:hypothetical protein HDU96_006814 [Phlyctochytrium bullatum]